MPPDHWRWCVMGFRGLLSMMESLEADGVEPSEDAKELLDDYYSRLKKLRERVNAKE